MHPYVGMASTTLAVNYLDEAATVFELFSYSISGNSNNVTSNTSQFNFVQLFFRKLNLSIAIQ